MRKLTTKTAAIASKGGLAKSKGNLREYMTSPMKNNIEIDINRIRLELRKLAILTAVVLLMKKVTILARPTINIITIIFRIPEIIEFSVFDLVIL